MSLVVLVVELELPEDATGPEALAATSRRVHEVLPVEPRRVWAALRETAEAVAALHGGG
jgi:hypothetical protein